MELRPVDLPLLRDEITQNMLGSNYRKTYDRSGYRHPFFGGAAEAIRAEVSILNSADLYFVSAEMTALAQAAAPTLPDFDLQPEDLPSKLGFLVFDGDLTPVPHGDPPLDYVVAGYTWIELNQRGVLHQPFTERDRMLDSLSRAGIGSEADVQYSRQMMSRLVPMVGRPTWVPYNATSSDADTDAVRSALKTFRAALLLMGQPLASVEDAKYDRASRRRIQKQGKEPPRVRVITLRRPAASGSGESDREWHHRWVVRGHWRMQPWGPARERRRPVWIAPHVKGPEGAPMLGGEKVYALRR